MESVVKFSFEDSGIAETIAKLIREVTNNDGALSYFEEVHITSACTNIDYAKEICLKSGGFEL